MTSETARDRIRRLQREWAEQRGLAVDALGYLPDYASNLRAPFSPKALKAFSTGAGSELEDSAKGGPAKMRALHSSAALAANVFDYFSDRDAQPLASALGVSGRPTAIDFEVPLSTGSGGIPPHLDLVIRLQGGGLAGIEAKFTEWMVKKSKQAEKLSPYVSVDGKSSYWSRAELPSAHKLVKMILGTPDTFQVLDVPQLLKHALGLKRAARGKAWSLIYLYYEGGGEIAERHDSELAQFSAAVGAELHFSALTYQSVISDLVREPSALDPAYVAYLRERYIALA